MEAEATGRSQRISGVDHRRILQALSRATPLGPGAVLAAAAPMLAEVAGVPAATFISWDGVSWRAAAGGAPELTARVARIPAPASAWGGVRVVPEAELTFVPVRPGSLGLALVGVIDATSPAADAVAAAAGICELMLADSERIRDLEDVLAELDAQQNVALEILSEREVDQVLLSITHKAIGLLDADMSGVLLVEGDNLVMRSCLGNRSTRTARLRMRAGQGLAGRVLETGEPTKVDDYLDSKSISHDFDVLAHLEDTRSALAAPLRAHGRMIGVLEVWRRRSGPDPAGPPPPFTDRHARRLLALANLATIAIENARLYNDQQQTLRQLGDTQASLRHQVDALSEATAMRRELTGLLLAGEGLPTLVRTIAKRTGGLVAVVSNDHVSLAHYPRQDDIAVLVDDLVRHPPSSNAESAPFTTPLAGGRWLTVQALLAGRDRLGWFCRLGEAAPDAALELAFGEAVLSCSLAQLEARATEAARAETRDEILIDLLEGTDERRQAAAQRAERMHVDLSRPHRVLRGLLDGFEAAAEAEGWDQSEVDRRRREIRAMARRVVATHAGGELVSVRGNAVVALVPVAAAADVHTLADALDAEIGRILPGVIALWGASTLQGATAGYRRADTEARVALRAAQRIGGERVAVYERLGVVRLLLASDQEADLGEFVGDVIGALIDHDRKHDGALIATLRAYFDADCGQQKAAQQLFVHPKTMRYRLERIQALSGLDLRRHEDRLRADLALRIHEVTEANRSGEAGHGP